VTETHTGSCLCGTVYFTIHGAMRDVIACHCTQCRKQSGHFYAATDVSDNQLSIERADNLTWYRASEFASRGFCKTCGSALFWKRDSGDKTSILAGALDGPTGLTISRHIFCAFKGDYYEICDGKPQDP